MSVIKAVKGMNDVLPGAKEAFLDSNLWQHILACAQDVFGAAGFGQALLPYVEDTALFARGIGQDTDIVSKEMYTFEDRGQRSLTLRPEGTAGAVRAYLEHNLVNMQPVQKWWYFGAMFRAERPQKGRYRQFYQIGAEYFGSAHPATDAELIALLWEFCQRLALSGVRIRLNSLGDAESRRAYRDILQDFLQKQLVSLCENCQQRQATNPLRVLDCKRPGCREVAGTAPDMADVLSDASKSHRDTLLTLLADLSVPVVQDKRLVRGLDYYTETIFEFTTEQLGAQDAILGGGRYNDLVSQLGGPATPAVGFAAGMERLALLCAEARDQLRQSDLYIIPMAGQEGPALGLAQSLRRSAAWRIEVDTLGGRLKTQMKRADRSGAQWALVLGEEEVRQQKARMKQLRAQEGAPVEVEVALTPDAVGKLLS